MADRNKGKHDQTIGLVFGALALLTTVTVAFAIGNTLGISSGRDQVSTQKRYDFSEQINLSACVERQGTAMVECVSEVVGAAQEQSTAQQDLYAQQDMSRWTFWLRIFTGITVAITALGVWFVKRTLEATLEAVEDTSKATDAMVEANHIAQTMGRVQVKSYLTLDNVECKQTIDGITFRVFVRNSGNSPALSVGSIVRVIHNDGSETLLDPEVEHTVPAHELASLATVYWLYNFLPNEGSLLIQAKVRSTDVFGEIELTDEFYAITIKKSYGRI